MSEKKVGYIIHSGIINKNAGGPPGYLYQLKTGLEKSSITDVKIISYISKSVKMEKQLLLLVRKFRKFALMNFFPKKYFDESILNLEIKNKEAIKNLMEIAFQNELNSEIAFVHFHYVWDVISNNSLRNNGNMIPTILTSHSPEAFHIEITYDLKNLFQKRVLFRKSKNFLISKYAEYYKLIDEKAFITVDYLMFPCEEAMEPYFETWPDFNQIVKNKDIFFVPSGVVALEHNLSREQIREKYNIPNDAFVVSYVGRHNHVKGYDLLQKAAEEVWRKEPNVYFLIAGKEFPIRGLRDKKWIEVGWTNIPGNIVNASDVFVLPNRRTFFDLILLEVMSIGKPIIASFTGGNKFVSRQTNGIITFEKENIADLVKKILDLSLLSRDELERLGLENKILYNNYYTPEKFALRYRKEVGRLFFGEIQK